MPDRRRSAVYFAVPLLALSACAAPRPGTPAPLPDTPAPLGAALPAANAFETHPHPDDPAAAVAPEALELPPADGFEATSSPADDPDPRRWAAADARALSAPKGLERDPAALVAYLVRGARGDEERARAIFRWLAENVSYDYAAMSDPRVVPPDQVLARGKSICDGYSSAFELLGRLAGLDVVTIHGYAKGYDWKPGYRFDRANHAWNAVKLGGRWRLVDSTWGAGFVRNGEFVKQLEDYFFLPAPEALAFTHLPEDPRWALVAEPLSLEEFESQPVARANFFRAGFSPADARAALRTGAAAALVQVFRSAALPFTVRAAPAQGVLASGGSYRFELAGPPGATLAVVNGGRWQYLKSRAGSFTGALTPRPGEVFVVARTPATGGSFETVLHYDVR